MKETKSSTLFLLRKLCCYLVFVLLGLDSHCTSDPLPLVCSDPVGSESIKVHNNQLFCFLKYTSTCKYDGCYWLNPSLPQTITNYIYAPDCIAGDILDVGAVKCLSQVVLKPTTGYGTTVTRQLCHCSVLR